MKKLLALLAVIAFWPLTAHADPKTYALTVAVCGDQSYKIGFDGPATIDTTGILCTTSGGGGGGGGTSSNFGVAFPGAGTAVGVKSGANMVNLNSTDGTSLDINCISGCTAGTASNATSGVATSSTNAKSNAWLYGFNGTTWDQLQVDGSKFLKTAVSSVPSGSIASGAFASGSVSSGAVASGAFASGSLASGAISNGADVAEGSTTDVSSTATDGTAATQTAILKEISKMEQAPASRAVTNAGAFAVQAAQSGSWTVTGAGGTFPVTAASGAIASGAVSSGAVASGAYASGSISDGADVTLGAKADAKSTATDTTAITAMQVLKEISAMEQAPVTRPVTNTGTFATQSAITAASGSIASGAIASGAIASGAIASGAVASGAFASGSISDGANVTLGAKADAKSTATDTTSITIMQVLKEISAMEQSPAALPANQSTNVAQINGVTPLMGNGVTGTGSPRVTIASDNTAFSVNAVESGTWTVQPGNTANTTAWLVQPVPGTANGLTTSVIEAAASDNHANIKNGAGVVYHISVFNNSATVNYLRLYNAATGFNGCNSATGLLWETNIPASTSGAGFVEDIGTGITFSTGISICITGAFGQTSTTNATASAISVNIGYK